MPGSARAETGRLGELGGVGAHCSTCQRIAGTNLEIERSQWAPLLPVAEVRSMTGIGRL